MTGTMTKTERNDLCQLTRQRARVLKAAASRSQEFTLPRRPAPPAPNFSAGSSREDLDEEIPF